MYPHLPPPRREGLNDVVKRRLANMLTDKERLVKLRLEKHEQVNQRLQNENL